MDKIFRRSTQRGNSTRHTRNEKNRKRNMIMNFRVSPEEKKLIETRIQLTGLTKSEFFIESCLYQTILVKGNAKTFSAIRNQMEEISEIIRKNPNPEELDNEQREGLKTILEILYSLYGKKSQKQDARQIK